MRRRIIVCLSLVLLLYLVGNVIAVICLRSSIKSLRLLADSHRIQALRANLVSRAVRVETDFLAMRAGNLHHATEREMNIAHLRDALHQCKGCHHAEGIQARLDNLHETFQAFSAQTKPIFEAGLLAGSEAEVLNAQELIDRLVVQATAMSDLVRSHMAIRGGQATQKVDLAWAVLIATMLVALAAGIAVAIHLKRRLTRPVEAILAGIEEVRNGDLEHVIAVEGDEEFRTLAEAFNRANAGLRTAQEGVLQAERLAAVGRLSTGVAHEVGNPLASISSIVQLMQRSPNTESQSKKLKIIMEEIGRISRIVRDLLVFSKPVAPKKRESVDIVSLLERAVTLLSYDRRAKELQTTLQHDVSMRPVSADADRLMLVFTNIMINAFDAIASAPPADADGALQITCRQEDDVVVVRFEDNGPGMTPDEMAEAFEPFFTTKAPGSGTGLGLWICYQVVQNHGGHITIESEPGKGACIVIRLPRESTTEPDALTTDE